MARAGQETVDSSLSDDVVKTITTGVETFVHDCPVLIKSLEALASVHPAIAREKHALCSRFSDCSCIGSRRGHLQNRLQHVAQIARQ